METHDVQRRGLGSHTIPGTLARLLGLTSDAVVVFDAQGRILLANDQAARLFRISALELQNHYICDFIRPSESDSYGVVTAPSVATASQLPFPVDGSLVNRTAILADGTLTSLGLRCEQISAPGLSYVLVAHSRDGSHHYQLEHERLVTELRRANHRLSGTLKIVISTINSADMDALFSDVLEELSDAMDASGTLMYMAEGSYFRLRGHTSSLNGMRLPKLLSATEGVIGQAVRAGNALRMTVLPPTREQLRQGTLTEREVIDESSLEHLYIPSSELPPFESFLCAPIRFGERVIAVIELGWAHAHVTGADDVRLLDAVGQYLSVQLATAISSMRSQRKAQLETMLRDIKDVIRNSTGGITNTYGFGDAGTGDDSDAAIGSENADAAADDSLRLDYVFSRLAKELRALMLPVCELNNTQVQYASQILGAELPDGTELEFTLPVSALHVGAEEHLFVERDESFEHSQSVVVLDACWALSDELRARGLPCEGVFIDLSFAAKPINRALLLRDEADGFDRLELRTIQQVCDEVRLAVEGEQARVQGLHIAQALQTGMKSVLQDVEGIEAQGLYSSATAAALVGGDFYDLVRLPDNKACVIIGDVSGKGVEAASVSAAVRAALEAYSWEGLAPARMVRSLNDFLLGFARLETFATLFVAVCDLSAGKLTYCSAGHPPAFLLRGQTGELEILGVQSGAVGAFKEMHYRDGQVELQESDLLFLYTDGAIEARNKNRDFFGEAALKETVFAEATVGMDNLLERILDRIDAFTGRKLEDDVAMVALRFDRLGPQEI